MPDAGDFERDDNARATDSGWGDAFAALPQEAPEPGGWQRVQARLPVPAARTRTRWPLWLASAASLLLAVAIPLRMLPSAQPGGATAASVPRTSATPASIERPAAATRPATPAVAGDAHPDLAATDAHPGRPTRMPSPPRPARASAPAADAARIAASGAAAHADLEPLYAQSAQLESLLALARDERVASGASAALSDALDTRVAAIDATLIQPGLSDAQRADLWSQRVDALQQLVGIETTNRLYAARGQRYDAALVSID